MSTTLVMRRPWRAFALLNLTTHTVLAQYSLLQPGGTLIPCRTTAPGSRTTPCPVSTSTSVQTSIMGDDLIFYARISGANDGPDSFFMIRAGSGSGRGRRHPRHDRRLWWSVWVELLAPPSQWQYVAGVARKALYNINQGVRALKQSADVASTPPSVDTAPPSGFGTFPSGGAT